MFFYLCHVFVFLTFLGRLGGVDLITLDGEMSVRQYVRTYVRPSTKSFFPISMKFGMYIEVYEWCTTVCRMTQSQVKVKVTGPLKFRKLHFSRSISSAIYNGSWEMTTDS